MGCILDWGHRENGIEEAGASRVLPFLGYFSHTGYETTMILIRKQSGCKILRCLVTTCHVPHYTILPSHEHADRFHPRSQPEEAAWDATKEHTARKDAPRACAPGLAGEGEAEVTLPLRLWL